MTPLPKAQVQQTAQVVLAALSDGRCVTPNDLIEGVVSGKSLLRGIINGQLVVCAVAQQGEQTPPAPDSKPVAKRARKAQKAGEEKAPDA